MERENYSLHGSIAYYDDWQFNIILIFMSFKINPITLEEWKKQGELLAIFRCDRCYKKTPFYKTNNELIDSIYVLWVRDHKNCWRCEKKREKNPLDMETKGNIKIIELIEKYEPKKEPINEELYA